MSEIAKVEQTQQSGIAAQVSQIERIASDPNVDVNKLETLWMMQEKAQDRIAKMAYNSDMASMQSKMPIIKKTGVIKDKYDNERSKYARFEDVISAIQPFLNEFGFSVSFKTEFHNSCLQVTGFVSHSQGHEESTIMTLPFDDSGAKNKVQAIGSSISYGKRYCLCMLLNIAASGEDDDGHSAAADELKKVLFARDTLVTMGNALRDNLPSVLCIKESIDNDDLPTAAEAWYELNEDIMHAINIAPSKGGVFTTEERRIIKEELSQFHQGRK